MPEFTKHYLFAATILISPLFFSGCEDDDPPDHSPAPGQGAIIVDNRTWDDIDVYIDGEFIFKVRDRKDRALDLPPGVYRIILDGNDDIGSYADDIDVLEGRNTILDTETDLSGDIDVDVFFD